MEPNPMSTPFIFVALIQTWGSLGTGAPNTNTNK